MKNATYASAIVLGLASIALVSVTAACGDDDTTTSSSGTSGATSGGTSGATSGGTSGATSGGTSGATSGGTSGGSSSGDAAKAACDNQKKCFPNTFAAEFKDDAECATVYGAQTGTALEGTDPKCGPGAVCGEVTAECSKGTLAKDKKCISGSQCDTGSCAGFTGTACGKCADAKKENDACSATDFNCGGDLRCDFAASKCVKALDVDGDCSGANAGACKSGLVCSKNKCAKPGQIDAACEEISPGVSLDCRGGLTCKDKKCADVAPKFLDADAACDPAKFATERCKTGFSCDATAKKCQKPTATGGLDCKN